MKIILKSDIYKVGVAGEVVDVADGYARNYLIPKKLAARATNEELRRASQLRAKAEANRAAYENRLREVAQQIDGAELVFFRRAANTGKLFGSVTTTDMAEELLKVTGIDINRRRISVQAIRDVGTHDIAVRMGVDVSPVLRVTVVPENQRLAWLAARDAEANAPAEADAAEADGDAAAQNPVTAVVENVTEAVEGAAGVVAGVFQGLVAGVREGLRADDNDTTNDDAPQA